MFWLVRGEPTHTSSLEESVLASGRCCAVQSAENCLKLEQYLDSVELDAISVPTYEANAITKFYAWNANTNRGEQVSVLCLPRRLLGLNLFREFVISCLPIFAEQKIRAVNIEI